MRILVLSFFLINIILAFSFQQEEYKLSLNSLLIFNYDYAQRKMDSKIISSNSFYFSKVYLDIINEYQKFFLLKFSLDVSDLAGKPSYELSIEIKPKKEMKVILGKFKQPLGYEISLLPKENYLFEPSFIYYWKEPFIYDLGIGFFYIFNNLETNINLVNGSGRLFYWDNNEWKNVSGRICYTPIKDLSLGVNFYYGKTGWGKIKDLLPFFWLGGELVYLKFPNIFIFEYLFGQDKDKEYKKYQRQGFYFLFGRQIDRLLPVIRVDFKREKKEVRELLKDIGFTFGLNYFLKDENLKIAPNFCFHSYSRTDYLIKFVLQFQGYI
ncbi:MAG: outer membrane beta-barrel protein [candidate division WOR-3 bacterium]